MHTGDLNEWKFVDPFLQVRGVLLSDLIETYVHDYEVLIDKTQFKRTNLKSASYSLSLGREYYYNGNVVELIPGDPERSVLVIPPNSFVIASTAERVILPHYIAARFGLRVEYVYKGLLVGAGPQVDPGYEGYLGCPVHNLTDTAVSIRVGEPYAWIDFTKTSQLGDTSKLHDSRALLSAARQHLKDPNDSSWWIVPGFHNRSCRLYVTTRKSFKDSLPAGITVSSSVKGLEDSVARFESTVNEEIASFRHDIDNALKFGKIIEIGSVLVLLAVLATVLSDFFLTHELAIRLENRVIAVEQLLQSTERAPQVASPAQAVPSAHNKDQAKPAPKQSSNGSESK